MDFQDIEKQNIKYQPIIASVISTNEKDTWLKVVLTEGKNREVRNALAHVNFIVKRLVRLSFGPYSLKNLPPGAVLPVVKKNI